MLTITRNTYSTIRPEGRGYYVIAPIFIEGRIFNRIFYGSSFRRLFYKVSEGYDISYSNMDIETSRNNPFYKRIENQIVFIRRLR